MLSAHPFSQEGALSTQGHDPHAACQPPDPRGPVAQPLSGKGSETLSTRKAQEHSSHHCALNTKSWFPKLKIRALLAACQVESLPVYVHRPHLHGRGCVESELGVRVRESVKVTLLPPLQGHGFVCFPSSKRLWMDGPLHTPQNPMMSSSLPVPVEYLLHSSTSETSEEVRN